MILKHFIIIFAKHRHSLLDQYSDVDSLQNVVAVMFNVLHGAYNYKERSTVECLKCMYGIWYLEYAYIGG